MNATTRTEHIRALSRMGPNMQSAIRYCAKQPAASKHELTTAVHTYRAYDTIDRCIEQGYLELDPDHPDATPQGDGAVVITEKGREFASLLLDEGEF